MVSATSERCIVRTQLDFFSLEDGGRGPGAKKHGQPLETGKERGTSLS